MYKTYGKLFLDIAFAFFTLIFLAPVMVVIALLVWIKLGRPIIFCQIRPGIHGKPFKLFKFRTMTDKCDNQGNLLSDKERLTSFGKILRRLSLDELPSLFNVIKREISFVGPRPLLMKYYPYFKEYECVRFLVRPGITGLAQISGRNDLSWDDRLALDADYVQKLSFSCDIIILLRTLWCVFTSCGIQVDPSSVMHNLDEERRQVLSCQSVENVRSDIRPARVTETREIFQIITEAFKTSSLIYTVYQTPRSKKYLREIIEGRSENQGQYVFVLEKKNSIFGFYHAAIREDQWFLNHIATRSEEAGKGLGNALFHHYEDQGCRRGCLKLALDVFESNELARTWYLRRGYEIESRKYLVRMDLEKAPIRGVRKLRFNPLSFRQALVQEKTRGFSKLCCRVGSAKVILGLIAGTTCKLLDRGDADLEDIISAAARTFGGERRSLILGDLLELPTSILLERSEVILRLSKDVHPLSRSFAARAELTGDPT